MDKHTMIRGSAQNPYHLSVGGVVVFNGAIGLIKKPDGAVMLPSETMYFDETLEACFIRGMQSELGARVKIERFIGAFESKFLREEGIVVQKTTVFFLGYATHLDQRIPTEDEEDDSVLWLEPNEAYKVLDNSQEMGKFIDRAMQYSV